MKFSVFVLGWVLLTVTSAVFAEQADDAAPAIVDEDYRFRLKQPGPDWVLADEAEIASIVPDALAGAYSLSRRGTWGAVVAESMPGVDLGEFLQAYLDAQALEDQEVESFEPLTWLGRPAVRMVYRGKFHGVSLRFVHQAVKRDDDYIYHLIAMGPDTVLDRLGEGARAFFDAFELLDGPIVERQAPLISRPGVGVGWRLLDGRYDSVVAGLALRPTSPWRVVVGTELADMMPDAEVGLTRRDPDVYLTVMVEKVPREERDAFEEQVWYEMTENTQPMVDEPPLAGVVGGEMTWFYRFELNTMPMEMLQGVLWRGDFAVRVLIWYALGHRDQAQQLLSEGLSAVRFLPPGELQQLEVELSQARDPENVVGTGFVLRDGTYRSFQNGFVWRKPAGFWRAVAGQAARAVNPDIELYFEEPTLGLYGTIAVEPARERSADDYHAEIAADWLGQAGDVQRVDAGGLQWRLSDGEVDLLGSHYHIATAVNDTQAVRLMTWGRPADIQLHSDQVQAVLHGFEHRPMLVPVVQNALEYTDHRLGFSLRPPAGWSSSDITPTHLRELGTMRMWSDGAPHQLNVLAINMQTDGQDMAWFANFFERMMNLHDQERGQGRSVTRQVEEFAGQPAQHLAWEHGQAWLFMRDRTLYAVLVDNPSDEALAAARGSFRLLDDEQDAAPPAADEQVLADYVLAIRDAITRNWLRPDSMPLDMRCAVKINQAAGGEVIGVEIAEPCNADELTQRSIMTAVQRTGTLPYAGFEAVFERQLMLTFMGDS